MPTTSTRRLLDVLGDREIDVDLHGRTAVIADLLSDALNLAPEVVAEFILTGNGRAFDTILAAVDQR